MQLAISVKLILLGTAINYHPPFFLYYISINLLKNQEYSVNNENVLFHKLPKIGDSFIFIFEIKVSPVCKEYPAIVYGQCG